MENVLLFFKKLFNLQSTSQGHNQSPLLFRKMQIYLTSDDFCFSLCTLRLSQLCPCELFLVKMFVRMNQRQSEDCEKQTVSQLLGILSRHRRTVGLFQRCFYICIFSHEYLTLF